ncbi:MAG: hypothetical protein MI861_28400 [Pirellulales bacterium]|nr:hypothetical protein [Pirellulales bacterium]
MQETLDCLWFKRIDQQFYQDLVRIALLRLCNQVQPLVQRFAGIVFRPAINGAFDHLF